MIEHLFQPAGSLLLLTTVATGLAWYRNALDMRRAWLWTMFVSLFAFNWHVWLVFMEPPTVLQNPFQFIQNTQANPIARYLWLWIKYICYTLGGAAGSTGAIFGIGGFWIGRQDLMKQGVISAIAGFAFILVIPFVRMVFGSWITFAEQQPYLPEVQARMPVVAEPVSESWVSDLEWMVAKRRDAGNHKDPRKPGGPRLAMGRNSGNHKDPRKPGGPRLAMGRNSGNHKDPRKPGGPRLAMGRNSGNHKDPRKPGGPRLTMGRNSGDHKDPRKPSDYRATACRKHGGCITNPFDRAGRPHAFGV
ncbi:hypothetical protein SCOR_02375 [Sulfidibacter corallicola]|uniref:Uncharacterized protein n=1 Tax=Sulfidibacter corallicola TaxID=2818388 RepID=A0A8A4TGF3_SULCO|nr:hypothetical protein [Sulfidibacter corallicola]QTD48630.1 hypothetical protein J3U87_23870 [Sulfidibacter corallicola]